MDTPGGADAHEDLDQKLARNELKMLDQKICRLEQDRAELLKLMDSGNPREIRRFIEHRLFGRRRHTMDELYSALESSGS